MRQFHSLTVVDKRAESSDALRLAIAVPEALRDTYTFLPGQHLPIRLAADGKPVRRTYSICSAPGEWPLVLGIRVQPGGRFSEYAANELDVGDSLEVMPPFGQFHANPDPSAAKNYLGVAAGSGITPILSIMKSLLQTEPRSRFTLFYGNRRQATTMFIDELYALKNRFPGRVQLHFVFSREEQEFSIAAGRLDAGKVRELYDAFVGAMAIDEAFVCGPGSMIEDVSAALVDAGVPAVGVHAERFGAPKQVSRQDETVSAADVATVTVIMDGHKKHFDMGRDDDNIVDAAAGHGIDLPYSCKGGVCATCRCHLRDGEVTMATNYGLEPWEVEAGFVLACQSRPLSRAITLDYDKL